MRRVQLPGGLAIWLDHVIAELEAQTDAGESVLMLQFDVASTTPASNVVTYDSPVPTKGGTQPAAAVLTPEQSEAYRAAVEQFTVQPGRSQEPQPLPN